MKALLFRKDTLFLIIKIYHSHKQLDWYLFIEM